MKRFSFSGRLAAPGIAVSMVLLLTSCPGVNPLNPNSFTNQFKHELRFNRTVATPADSTVAANELDVVMVQIRAKVDSPTEPVRIDSLAFRATGSGDDQADIGWARLYRDRNGDAQVDSGDVLLASASKFNADNGKVRFNNINLTIDHDESDLFLLVYDLSGTASPGETFQVRLADEGDVDAEGDDSGCPVTVEGIPVVSPERTIGGGSTGTAELLVSVGPSTPPAREVGTAASGVELIQVAVQTTGSGDAMIESITFQGGGTAHEVDDISAVYLFRDVNGNGLLDLGQDVLLSLSAYTGDDGSVTFPGIDEVVPARRITYLLMVYDLGGGAWIGETMQARIDSPTDLIASDAVSGTSIDVVGPPVLGEVITIKLGE